MKVILFMNDNVIYIDYLDSYLGITNGKCPKWIRKIIYKFLNYIGFIRVRENYAQLTCMESDVLNERMMKNFLNKLSALNSKNLVLADILLDNKVFVDILKRNGYGILNGKWLYKFLSLDIVYKIAYIQNLDLQKMEITVLSNDDSDINIEVIKVLAQKCKILNILTENIDKFEVLERFLFDEYGTIINLSSNKSKTCLYSDLVLNFDFNIQALQKCIFRKNTVLVQLTKEKFENREGVTIVFCKLDIPFRCFEILENTSHFNEEVLYESSIYHKLSFENGRKILLKDKIGIRYFYGNNGKIDFREIKNCCLKNNLCENA